ncbi:MAG: C39 family peptidase [Patescibacteria group bacterium]|nr:C39 family peptidase [Patescibacteria group bacterium]
MLKFVFFSILIGIIFLVVFNLYDLNTSPKINDFPKKIIKNLQGPTPTPTLISIPNIKILENDYHIYQSFNNCGPAALSMALSYFGINESQEKLGQDLRPYQNPEGENDDKSVSLDELAEKSKSYDLIPYHRPNGNIDLIKLFITYDIPVITRTLTKENEDIGHYRIIKGFDDGTGELIQDDSLQGKNLRYSYGTFNNLWQQFNFEYLVLVPKDKEKIVKIILGEDINEEISWKKAVANAKKQLENNPDDIFARFNLSIALCHIGEYKQSIDEFEKIENKLPWRTLWYQIEPVQAYFNLGNYDRVFSLTDTILNNHNRAFSEVYLIRGETYLKKGDRFSARQEFEKAYFYNKNLKEAKEALNSVN